MLDGGAVEGDPGGAEEGGVAQEGARRILVVEDEEEIRALLADYLTGQGLEVRTAGDGRAMRAALAGGGIDLVLLDIGLPEESGLELAQEVRRAPGPPGLVFLTGAGALPERLAGLQAGADDYLVKPFEPRELLARIQSELRRLPARPTAPAGVPFGRCRLDPAGRRLLAPDGAELPVTAMEWDLLLAFLRHPRQVLSRAQLARLAHGRELGPTDRSIDVRITRLRRKIEADPENPRTIRTVRGQGYLFEPAGEAAQ